MIIQHSYNKEFRDSLLRAYFTGTESGSAIARRFGVNPGTVSVWITRYKNQYIGLRGGSANNPIFAATPEPSTTMPEKNPDAAELQERIKHLEKELAHERMRTTCLEKMIEIAERDLNLSIRKNSGAKQSKK